MKILVIMCCLLFPLTIKSQELQFSVSPLYIEVIRGETATFIYNIVFKLYDGKQPPYNVVVLSELPDSIHTRYNPVVFQTKDVAVGTYNITFKGYCIWGGPSVSVTCLLRVTDNKTWKMLTPAEAAYFNSGISKDNDNHIIGFSIDSSQQNSCFKTRFEDGNFSRTGISLLEKTFVQDKHGNFWHVIGDSVLLHHNQLSTDVFRFPSGVKRKIRSVVLDRNNQPIVYTPFSPTYDFSNEIYRASGDTLTRIFTVKDDFYYQYDNFDFGMICVDSANNFWTNATARGVFRQDNAATSRYFSRNNADPIGETTLVQCDKKGNVWFAAGPDSTSVLSAFDGKYWWFIPGIRNELKNIIALDFDSEGRIWCGTKGAGLWRYEGVSWKQYSLSNSLLPSNDVTKVLVDNNDNVWAVTPAGIVVFNPNGLKGMTPPASSGETPKVTPAFEVSPQPANETVTVQWGNPADELILYDAFGRAALRLPLAAETSRTFSVSGLMNGVYFCSVGNAGGQIIISR